MDIFLIISFLYVLELLCFHTSVAVASAYLNSFNYCYLTLINIFNINHLFVENEAPTSIAI